MPRGRHGGRGRRHPPSRPPHSSLYRGGRGGASCRRDRERRFNLDALRTDVYRRLTGGRGCNYRVFTYGGYDRYNNNQQQERPDKQEGQDSQTTPEVPVLTVKSVDLNITENTKAHHTDRYEICNPKSRDRKLVIRRGQPFNIDIDFSGEYDASKDDLKLVFEAGENPRVSKGTCVEFILSDEDQPNKWGAKIISQKGNHLSIQVFTPPNLFVGKWEFSVDVVDKKDTDVDIYKYEHDDPIYVIFNPWCKDDAVYLDDEEMLKEYILNETGRIYCGSQVNITSRPWNFGQFESCVLDCAMYLLELAELNWAVRGNPIAVVRKLSAMVNSQDEGGILVGNWSGDYGGGRSPLTWTGSVAILERYWEAKRPVKFGQCWVFSGVSTTVCRALGIPSRSVTNFASAHDTDGSVTIDSYYNSELERDSDLCDDSVWNFHVWNEAWMARPDLPKGYGGWQAFDATPQETSDDVYCCGPVSVLAIKQGEINLPYDAPFVFAEVNADQMYWATNKHGKTECVHCETGSVGKFISTKTPNSQDRLDITLDYKPPEGSAEERAAVLKANQVGSTRHDLYEKKAKDVEFSIKQDSGNTWVGGDFEASLHMVNISKETRTVSGRIAVSTMYYTGVIDDKLKSEPFDNIVLKPGEEVLQHIKVTSNDYEGKLRDCCMLDVSVWATVEETNQIFTCKKDFRLRKPHLTIKAPSEAKAGQEFKVEISFLNPMNTSLTKCFVAVDGLASELSFPQSTVDPKKTFLATIPVTPKKLGQLELILSFNSTQLEDINGSHSIFVRDN